MKQMKGYLNVPSAERIADINARGQDNWTTLHVAANEGYMKIAEVLLQLNVNIDAQTQSGRTALHIS
jgi:ankyrin repeat protein